MTEEKEPEATITVELDHWFGEHGQTTISRHDSPFHLRYATVGGVKEAELVGQLLVAAAKGVAAAQIPVGVADQTFDEPPPDVGVTRLSLIERPATRIRREPDFQRQAKEVPSRGTVTDKQINMILALCHRLDSTPVEEFLQKRIHGIEWRYDKEGHCIPEWEPLAALSKQAASSVIEALQRME